MTRSRADELARAEGLWFPVDPSSGAFATIGGMAATNAAGARSLRHGAMRRWVRSLDCVFADGSRAMVSRDNRVSGDAPPLQRWRQCAGDLKQSCLELPRRAVRKESSGFGVHDFAESGDLVDLLVGSEGTLAFFTGLDLDLIPLPSATSSLLSSWPTLEQAVRGSQLAREARVAACELLDATFLSIASRGRSLPIPSEAECVLLVEIEAAEAGEARATAEALSSAWSRAGASNVLLGLDPESEEGLWSLRHAASPILSRLDPHIRSMQVIEDGCVPPHLLADYVRGVRAALSTSGFEGVLFGHAGDANIHANALVDVREADWKDRIRKLFADVVDLTADLGGTLSGEHGDGRLRTGVMHRFWDDATMQVFRRIKDAFDPRGILNPGVKDGSAVDPFERIKYDPSDPLGNTRAERVLSEIEAARIYESCRLEMLDVTG